MKNIQIGLGIQYIGSFKRLAYESWYALAEFVDNSTQSYLNNKDVIDEIFKLDGGRLEININYSANDDTLIIQDNSIGMSADELTKALIIGTPKGEEAGRSKYGIGLKTAACWFGNTWTVNTKKLNELTGTEVTIDVNKIVDEENPDLLTKSFDANPEDHYTIITITNLNKKLRGKTISKIKEFLRSIYRMDFKNYGLILNWQGESLSWTGFEDRLYITQENKPYKKDFKFEIGDPKKTVRGWVGVLAKGSRDDAGFSVIQNDRVIQGCPKAYRPSKLFGEQEMGTNDLVNQRLVGELFVDGFAVSHTKDKILWENDEEEELENQLKEICSDARALAQNLRVGKITNIDLSDRIRTEALTVFETELKSDEFKDRIFVDVLPSEKVIELSYKKMVESTVSVDEPSLLVQVGDNEDSITVKVFLRRNSEFEPYVLIETTSENNTIVVIINILHPYFAELKNLDGYLVFIRHSVYDGISEWKAIKKTGKLNPDTIKYIKDSLMRLPYEILNNKFSPSINED
jgi:hypothetical protein